MRRSAIAARAMDVHFTCILQISSKSCNDRKDQLFSLSTHMLHTTVTARARRTRCAHAQLAPTDFSDTCLSAHCLRPPPGRTHSHRLRSPWHCWSGRSGCPSPQHHHCRDPAATLPQQTVRFRRNNDAWSRAPMRTPTLRRRRRPPTQTTPPQRAQYACCGDVMHAAVLAVPKLLLPPVHPLHSTAPNCTQAHSPTAATAAPTSPFAAFLAKRGKITHTWTTREALTHRWR